MLSNRKELLIILGITLIFWTPLFLVRGYFWDDWVERWIYDSFNFKTLLSVLYQNAHVGWVFLYGLWFDIGGAGAGVFSRVTGVVCHGISAYLIYRIIAENQKHLGLARLTMLIFLFSPFYSGHVSYNFNIFDVFLTVYLLSILLIDHRNLTIKALGYVCLVAAFSFETLIALEVFRLFYLVQKGYTRKVLLRKCLPIWLLLGVLVVLRLTLLKAHGIYAGYHALTLSHKIPGVILKSYIYYINMLLWSIKLSVRELTLLGFIVGVILVGSFSFYAAKFTRIGQYFSNIAKQERMQLMYFALIFTFVSMFPYALTLSIPSLNFGSRLVGVGVVAAPLLLSVALLSISNVVARIMTIGCFLFLFATSLVYSQKWALFDDLIQRDLFRQLAWYGYQLKQPEVTLVGIEPKKSEETMYQNRCLYPQDLNAPQILWNGKYTKNIYYDLNCYRYHVHLNPKTQQFNSPCVRIFGALTDKRLTQCPQKISKLAYVLSPDFRSPANISLYKLIAMAAWRTPSNGVVGHLTLISGDNQFLPYKAQYWKLIKPKSSTMRYIES